MEIMEGCLPCLLRQAEDAAKRVSDDPDVHKAVTEGTKKILENYKVFKNAPSLAEAIHCLVKKETNNGDPYKKIKTDDINAATELIPTMNRFIKGAKDTLYASLKVSAAGNNLDSAVYKSVDIKGIIDAELGLPFTICDIDTFSEKLRNSKTMLIIGDNAGEAVFDKVFISSLPSDISVTYAVRSAPIINDVTVAEAMAIGLDKTAEIMPSGSSAPGTVLSQISKDFKEALSSADIVISKGQGNFESLSEVKGIFFLLKAKCPVIAERFGVKTGSYIFRYNK
ncbi:MAG: DUF89 family protein [Clostridia bacterium]|nr:DUF89 family protein [Clostridia bacterium]